MNRLAQVIEDFVRRTSESLRQDQLMQNIGWYGLAEAVARLSRLVTTVLLARSLSAYDLGIAATAITCFELVRVFSNNGINQVVIRAAPDQLAAVTNTAYRLSWAFCTFMAVLQIVAGGAIAWGGGKYELFPLIACLAGVFLLMPSGLIHVCLLMREGNLKRVSQVSIAQVVADNFLTAVFAVAGAGPWAIVLPKLLTAPIWLWGVRRGSTWKTDRRAGFVPCAQILRSSIPVLGSELLSATRLNADKFLVGAILGVESLGVYYFVFNAGIGFSLSLTSALSNSIFPELVKHAHCRDLLLRRFDQALLHTVAPISALIVLQASAALVYVPLVFGAKWEVVAPLVSVLCLSACAKPFYDATIQLLRAAGLNVLEFTLSSILTVACLCALVVMLPMGLNAGVASMAATGLLIQFGLAIFGRWAVKNNQATNRSNVSNFGSQPEGIAAI